MRNQNRVLWKEGLFIQPQHFQQQQRHIDYLIGNQLTKFNNTYNFGFQKLELNQEMLNLGKFSLLSATGVFPDGTYFELPHQDLLPSALDVQNLDNLGAYDIYLALPNASSEN